MQQQLRSCLVPPCFKYYGQLLSWKRQNKSFYPKKVMCVNGLGHFGPFLVASLSSQPKFPTVPIAAGRCLRRLLGMELFSGNIPKSSYFVQEASTGGLHGKLGGQVHDTILMDSSRRLVSKFFGSKAILPTSEHTKSRTPSSGIGVSPGTHCRGISVPEKKKMGQFKGSFSQIFQILRTGVCPTTDTKGRRRNIHPSVKS